MANWYGSARTNHFKVKNVDVFIDALTYCEVDVEVRDKESNTVVMSSNTEDGDFSTHYIDPNEEDSIEIDWPKLVAPHLTNDTVCIFMAVGAEKLRYLTGYAYAFDCTAKVISVNLTDIYTHAAIAFQKTPVSRAEY